MCEELYLFQQMHHILSFVSLIFYCLLPLVFLGAHCTDRCCPTFDRDASGDVQLREMSAFALGRLAQIIFFPCLQFTCISWEFKVAIISLEITLYFLLCITVFGSVTHSMHFHLCIFVTHITRLVLHTMVAQCRCSSFLTQKMALCNIMPLLLFMALQIMRYDITQNSNEMKIFCLNCLKICYVET